MKYFLKADPHDDVEAGYAIILRLEAGAPWALGEALFVDGTWGADDDLYDYHLRGSTDVDINEIPADRAREIVLARHASGRYKALPDPLPGDPGSDTPARTDDERAARMAQWAPAAQAQAATMSRFAAVQAPAGAADITVPREYRTVEE